MNWIVILIIATFLIEAAIIWFYSWMQKNMPEQSLWVIMGSKILKLLLAVGAILLVYAFVDDIEIKHFSLGVITAYLISLVLKQYSFSKEEIII